MRLPLHLQLKIKIMELQCRRNVIIQIKITGSLLILEHSTHATTVCVTLSGNTVSRLHIHHYSTNSAIEALEPAQSLSALAPGPQPRGLKVWLALQGWHTDSERGRRWKVVGWGDREQAGPWAAHHREGGGDRTQPLGQTLTPIPGRPQFGCSELCHRFWQCGSK